MTQLRSRLQRQTILIALLGLLWLPRAHAVQTCPQVTVMYHGQVYRTAAREETFSDLLTRLDLEPGQWDVLSHDPLTALEPGMTLRVDTVLTRREEYSVSIPYETRVCDDAALPADTWQVVVPGQDGQLSCVAEVTYINGRETARRVLSQTQTIPPVTQVEARGTAPVPAEQPAGDPDLPEIGDGYIRLTTGEVLTYTGTATVRASAYTHTDAGCDLITATGSRVHVGTVAVDPRYIPYGTRMFIITTSGSYVYGVSEAEDCGGAIKGDRVDLYMPTYDECMEFGRRVCTVYYLG